MGGALPVCLQQILLRQAAAVDPAINLRRPEIVVDFEVEPEAAGAEPKAVEPAAEAAAEPTRLCPCIFLLNMSRWPSSSLASLSVVCPRLDPMNSLPRILTRAAAINSTSSRAMHRSSIFLYFGKTAKTANKEVYIS